MSPQPDQPIIFDPKARTFRIVDGQPVPVDEAEAREDRACSMCSDTGLMLGGWMGPTEQAPWPRACSRCERGAELDTPRKVQLRVTEIVGRDAAGEGEGWWTHRYPVLARLAEHLQAIEDATAVGFPPPPVFDPRRLPEPFDLGGKSMGRYVTDDDLKVVVSREGMRPTADVIAEADVWKIVRDNGDVEVVKHRHSAPYMECALPGGFGAGRCTEPRNHAGQHRDDATGRRWG